MTTMLHIDGSHGEGGGQVLRTSLTLSLLTGQPFVLDKVRAKRTPPGLKAQHLECVRAAQRIGSAEVQGDTLGSLTLHFSPQALNAGVYEFTIHTAGATALVAQTVALPLAFAGQSRATITGGTHVEHAPCIDFLDRVFLPPLARMGLGVTVTLSRPGYFPRGGGCIDVEGGSVNAALRPLVLEQRGELQACEILTRFTDLPDHVNERAEAAALAALKPLRDRRFPLPKGRRERGTGALNPGGATVVWGHWTNGYAGFQSLAAIGKPAEKVGTLAARDFVRFVTMGKGPDTPTVDEHLADQLLLPCALAVGESRFRTQAVTDHLLTNAEVLRNFLPDCRITIDGDTGAENAWVCVKGVGFTPRR